jgi:4-hydroxy-4-methyl-2-oxoglutarate aldolase
MKPMSTSAVSDALDMLGVPGQLRGIRPMVPGTRCAGPAYTVTFAPVTDPSEGAAADYLEDVAPGSVVVLDNGGRTDCTVWGDLLTAFAELRGVAGTVVWGAARDNADCVRAGYPVFAAAGWMRTGKGRVRRVAVGEPVEVGGVRIEAGDMIVADDDGVVCVPAASWSRACELAEEVERREAAIKDALLAGLSLAEARQRNRYSDLGPGGSIR